MDTDMSHCDESMNERKMEPNEDSNVSTADSDRVVPSARLSLSFAIGHMSDFIICWLCVGSLEVFRLVDNEAGTVLYEVAGKCNLPGIAGASGDVILFGDAVIETEQEGFFDAAAFLVDGVFCRVDDGEDAAAHLVDILTVGDEHIQLGKFDAVVAQVLEHHAFGVAQIEEVEGFGQRFEMDFDIAVVGEHDLEVGRDDQWADDLRCIEQREDEGFADTEVTQLFDTLADLIADLVYFVVGRVVGVVGVGHTKSDHYVVIAHQAGIGEDIVELLVRVAFDDEE